MDAGKHKVEAAPPKSPNDSLGLRRAAAAIAVSTLLHIAVALYMRPTYTPVNDYAVDFETVNLTPPPPPPSPEPEPKPEPEPEPVREPEPPKKRPKKKIQKSIAKAASSPVQKPSADKPAALAADAGTNDEKGDGICMHNLFVYAPKKPTWLLYTAAAAFRGSVYEQELGNTFSSFALGKQLARMTGMDVIRDVEALMVTAEDIFDWQTFEVTASYDFGEEALKTRINKRQKKYPDFAWTQTPDGFEAAIPGQFRWRLTSSGRVMSVVHEPEEKKKVAKIPDNPFDISSDIDTDTTKNEASPEVANKRNAAKQPEQIECIRRKETAEPEKLKPSAAALAETAERLMTPDAEGHWPAAVLVTSDPGAVGIGARLGRRMGFEAASVRGYFTDPVRLEGHLRFNKNPEAVKALAEDWEKNIKKFAANPPWFLAGVSSMLSNLKISAEDTSIHFFLEMQQGQVLAALTFLQHQGYLLKGRLIEN
jgi:hypothetical protein